MEIWRSACGRYTVRLANVFVDAATRTARYHYPSEVGAPLVGTYSDDGREAQVSEVGPLPRDSRASRFAFERGVHGLRDFFGRVFKRTRGLSHYVGEWHSHPEGAPVPSATDDAAMLAIARDPQARCPECVLVLVALRGTIANTGVYVYSRERGRVDLRKEAPSESADAPQPHR
jgi:integrative and conjugative element protein (TIGR02256 family)